MRAGRTAPLLLSLLLAAAAAAGSEAERKCPPSPLVLAPGAQHVTATDDDSRLHYRKGGAAADWQQLADIPDARYGSAMLWDGGDRRLWVVGGHNGRQNGWSFRVDTFHLDGLNRWVAAPSLPFATINPAAAWLPKRKALLVTGGYGFEGTLDAFAMLQTADGKPRWEMLQPMPTARSQAASVYVPADDSFYVLGGRSGDEMRSPLDVVERYDCRRRQWLRLPPLPVALSGAAAVWHEASGSILLHGGRTSMQTLALLRRFDVATRKWSVIAQSNSARTSHGMALDVVTNSIILAGGLSLGERLLSVERYDLQQHRWHDEGSMPYSGLFVSIVTVPDDDTDVAACVAALPPAERMPVIKEFVGGLFDADEEDGDDSSDGGEGGDGAGDGTADGGDTGAAAAAEEEVVDAQRVSALDALFVLGLAAVLMTAVYYCALRGAGGLKRE